MNEYRDFMLFAHKMADTSNRITMQYLETNIDFQTKNDYSPVTVVDRRIEETLRGMIAGEFPNHGILGEEFENENIDAEYVWVIDPIDGTKAFITGMPVYGTLISLTRNGHPVLGIIDHPVTRERWTGLEGEASTHNGAPIKTRACPQLAEAIVSIGNPESLQGGEAGAFGQLRAHAKWGIYGGNCYVYGRLAMGRVDISLDGGLDPFDFCALEPVVRGAGGIMTDWEGRRLSIRSGHRVVACGDKALHRQVVEMLQNS